MQSEKMMILKMLQDGKINADEAARLLAGAESGSATPMSAPRVTDAPRPNAPPHPESAVDSMGRKLSEFAKTVEPKIKKATEVVVSKTASAAESISKSLSSHGAPKSSYAPPTGIGGQSGAVPPRAAAPATGTGGVEEVIEIKVTESGAELNLAGLNGQVLVKGYNGDKISAKIFTIAKRAGAKAQLATLGNKYYLSFDENDFERVCIDAFVPETMFNNIKVSTINGDLSLSTVSSQYVYAENMNGQTEIVGVSAVNLTVESNNGNLAIKDTTATTANIENFNGAININKVDIGTLKTNTFNGGIDMQIANLSAHDSYKWNVETSNGKMSVVLPTYTTIGYNIKAHAALDNVKLGLVSMNYTRNDSSFVEAKSSNYEAALKKVDMELATSNAPLIIN
ncbi:MAG: DUF4097 family beta strand repeat-containing protein [Defluviitaleaceae bacterium]|nr:DUF4097 family beta strand repeat-containing protein [Defluviitaleaceae bacterium]